MAWMGALSVLGAFLIGTVYSEDYYGKSLGKLSEFHHGVSGHVYAVDGRTLFIKDFTYDGEGPAAYFYVGNTKTPSNSGAWRLRDERGSSAVLRKYRKKDITLSLPEGKTLQNIKWFSVWCDEFSVNFGDVKIPRNFEYPKPLKIGSLSGVHGVSSDPIVIVDAQTLLIPNFSYDGEAPDAKFWVGAGDKPTPQGLRIPDENGKVTPLRRYDHKTIVLTLPSDLTVFDIGHFGVWCEAFTVDFGHVSVKAVTNVPPSLKMLGVSPQSKLNCEVLFDDLAFEVRWAVAGESIVLQLVAKLEDGEYMSFGISGNPDHSQMVGGDVTVAWVDKNTLKGYAYDYFLDAKSQCAGTRGSCPDENLGENTNSVRLLNAAMVNGYSIVTYQRPLRAADELDRAVVTNGSQPIIWAIGPLNSKNEVSYHSQFTKGDRFLEFGRAPVWNCPMPEMDDGERHPGRHESSTSSKISGKVNNGQFLTETTHLAEPNEKDDFLGAYDDSTSSGTLDNTHSSRAVPTPKPVPKTDAWDIPPINCYEPEDGVFYAQMGPTGGKHGYPAITGHVGWGISWYINGLLIPEINVVRGKTYTFVVEGGHDVNTPARYHPFYITDDSVGGFEHKTPEEKKNVNIYAGVRRTRSGDVTPTGVGRLCNWTPDIDGPPADEFPSFGAYQRSLTLVCDQGEPGVITWTPDEDTPDTVYYQCFTHRYLGWKINVLNSCDTASQAEASEIHETFARSDLNIGEEDEVDDGEDLESRASVQVATRVRPDANYLHDNAVKSKKFVTEKNQYTKNLENHNMNGFIGDSVRNKFDKPNSDILTGEVEFANIPDLKKIASEVDLPISESQLKQVIEQVESYETKVKASNNENENHPIYHHSTQSPDINDYSLQNSDLTEINSIPERPLHEDEELIIELKDTPSKFVLPPNQKPMTLQTFLRPFPGKHGPQFFRRPVPPEIKVRRPPFMKTPSGMPPTRYPSQFLLGQPTFIAPNKKPFYKMPMNIPPPPPAFGRPPPPPPGMPNKPFFNGPNTGKPMLNGHHNSPKPQNRPIIMGKPTLISQTLTLGQPTAIGQHPSITQSNGPFNDAIGQQSRPETYFNKPGQIIMGKPMERPLPLDQQMSPTRHQIVYVAPTTPQTLTTQKIEIVTPSKYIDYPIMAAENSDISPSELMSVSPDPNENIITLRPAINTGFKPDSVVIEGGFKPIIREPLLASEDKIAIYDNININRRSDNDANVYDEKDDEPVNINNDVYKHTLLTETFEPMFIPSPLDSTEIKKNESNDDNQDIQFEDIRPNPVYVSSDTTEPTVTKKFEDVNMDNLESKNIDDLTMAADRLDAYYLPPDPNQKVNKHKESAKNDLPLGTVVAFDGHAVSDSTLTSSSQNAIGSKLYSAKLSGNLEFLTKIPQFGPYKGEIPPLSPNQNPISKSQIVNSHSYPLKAEPIYGDSGSKSEVSFLLDWEKEFEKKLIEALEPEASEKHEVAVKVENNGNISDDTPKRSKRAAHHTPDHNDGPGYVNSPKSGILNDTQTNRNQSQHHDHAHDHSHDHHATNDGTSFPYSWELFVLLPMGSFFLYLKL